MAASHQPNVKIKAFIPVHYFNTKAVHRERSSQLKA